MIPAGRASLPRFALLIVLGLPSATAPPARADMATLLPLRDNTLYEDPLGALSNGAGQYMFAGTTVGNLKRRAMVEFDLASIPAGSTITNVELTLHMSRTINAAQFVDLHRLLSGWGEGDSVAPGEEGGGAAAQPGDATWVHTHYDTQTWSAPGGDFDPIASAAQLVVSEFFYTWTATTRLLDDVQDWLDNPAQNHGWLIRADESFPTSAKRFDTRENANPDFHPRLFIEYTPIPEPTAVMPLALGAAVLRLRRRPSDRREPFGRPATRPPPAF